MRIVLQNNACCADNQTGRHRDCEKARQTSSPDHEDYGLRTDSDEEKAEPNRDGPGAAVPQAFMGGSVEVDEPVAVSQHAAQFFQSKFEERTAENPKLESPCTPRMTSLY